MRNTDMKYDETDFTKTGHQIHLKGTEKKNGSL